MGGRGRASRVRPAAGPDTGGRAFDRPKRPACEWRQTDSQARLGRGGRGETRSARARAHERLRAGGQPDRRTCTTRTRPSQMQSWDCIHAYIMCIYLYVYTYIHCVGAGVGALAALHPERPSVPLPADSPHRRRPRPHEGRMNLEAAATPQRLTADSPRRPSPPPPACAAYMHPYMYAFDIICT